MQKELKLDDWDVGYDDDRLNEHNMREIALSIHWRKYNANHNIVGLLVPNATRRDHKVAATIMQWLGTNVGMSFLDSAMHDAVQTNKAARRILDSLRR